MNGQQTADTVNELRVIRRQRAHFSGRLATCVVAISLSEFASKTDEIFRCKKHTILLTISGYIYL